MKCPTIKSPVTRDEETGKLLVVGNTPLEWLEVGFGLTCIYAFYAGFFVAMLYIGYEIRLNAGTFLVPGRDYPNA